MASPLANGHLSTPPSSDPAAPSTFATLPAPSQPDPDVPLTSLSDDGQTRRPRDARLIHLVLSSLGIHSYQERVPLQLLDFAYRYTSSVLSDSLRLAAEGYTAQNERGGPRGRGGGTGGAASGAGGEEGQINVTALRQAIASRQGFTFQGALPKEFMLEQAAERNRVALPKVERGYGVQLPPEKYCLTGASWGLKEEWDEEEEDEDEDAEVGVGENGVMGSAREDEMMGGVEEDEEGEGRLEDVFGEEGGGGDTSMTID